MALLARSSVKRNGEASRLRHVVSALVAMLVAFMLASAAWAQAPPPVFRTIDDNGVDVMRGGFNLSVEGVSIGQPDTGGLAFARSLVGDLGWRHNFEGRITIDGSTYTVSIGAASATFTENGGAFTSDQRVGDTLSFDSGTSIYIYTTASGAEAQFAGGRITQMTQPNGERITFHYRTETINGTPYVRLQSVTNNLGYQLHFQYALNNPTTPGDIPAWQTLTVVTAINNAVDYCDPTANACTGLTVSWPTFQIARSGVYETMTDALGRVTRITYSDATSVRVVALRRPSSSTTDHVTIAYNGDGRVQTVRYWRNATEYEQWSYSYNDPNPFDRYTTVTNPLNHQTVYRTTPSNGRLLSVTDPLGRTTSFWYDGYHRLYRTTYPEGNYVNLTHDNRGNVTETRHGAKSGSGLSDIVTTAVYESNCSNPRTCNQPQSTTDARGFRTDYTYDATHGGILTVTQPAPNGAAPIGTGTRPQTRFTYETRYAYYKNASGSIVAAPTPVYRLVEVSACATTASCDGGADETVSTIAYGQTGVANNLLPTANTIASGNGTLSATTTMSYDNIGNVTSVDGPLSGTADQTMFRYDAARQLIGAVGPDPDGGGALLHRAIRTTYNLDGQTTAVEQGTVASFSNPDWANFAVLERQETDYDFIGRSIRSNFIAQSQTHAVVQMSYDGMGRLDCTAFRMNPAVFASLPASACSLSTQGAGGPDRIARYTYNNANQPTRATQAYGTAAAIDEWTVTYTNNGLVATMADAGSNLTTYEYDGFDRLRRLRFPNATGGGSSTTNYEEYTYNAASAVTLQRRRDATTIGFTYDNLGRVTLTDVSANGDDVSASYDLFGRQLTQSTSGQTLSFAYDQLSRLTSAQSPLGTVSYQYDLAGRRTRITWPDAFYVQYDFDLTNAVTAVRENGATSGAGVLAAYAYDNLGRRTLLTRGNGTTQAYSYSPAARLIELANNFAGTTHDQTLDFEHNVAGQITERENSNASFDWSPLAPATINYADNGLNQYTAVGGVSFSYDTRGNLTSDGSRTFAYDIFNRLVSVSGAASMTLAYDPLGRLYETQAGGTTTRFLYDGVSLIGEYNTGGALQRRYVHGPAIDEPIVWYEGVGTTDRRWLVADQLGTITAVTDGSGAVTAIYAYDEYGRPNAWSGARFRFTGQMMLPEAQLYHYRARAYDPVLGRFLQTDPILFAGGMNIYAYVENDPINASDPLGLCTGTRIPTTDCAGIAGFSTHGGAMWGGGDGSRFQPDGDDLVITGHRFVPSPSVSDLLGGFGGSAVLLAPIADANDDVLVIGRRLVQPYLGGYYRNDPRLHLYELGPTLICLVSAPICRFNRIDDHLAAEHAPFSLLPRRGSGRYNLLGMDPIEYRRLGGGVHINITLPGHRFHPGRVVSALYEANGGIYLYTVGIGVGANGDFNELLGSWLFGGIHADLTYRFGAIGRW